MQCHWGHPVLRAWWQRRGDGAGACERICGEGEEVPGYGLYLLRLLCGQPYEKRVQKGAPCAAGDSWNRGTAGHGQVAH